MARIGLDARLTYYRRGGITEYIEALLRELPLVDAENEYIVLQSRKDPRNLASGRGQRKVACWTPAHHRLERMALGIEAFPLRLDLLHSPDFIPPYGPQRSIITIHDLTFLHYPEFLTPESRRYYNDQIEDAVRRANHIMTDSEATRRDVIAMLRVPEDKVTTVLLGVSERFNPVVESTLGDFLAQNRLPRGYILFVGTLEPRKNLKGLILAYQQLLADHTDLPPLMIAGQRGWLNEELHDRMEEPGLADHIRWLEDIAPGDLPSLYSGAAVLCLPSFYEGFGFPPLEAMACGTPVVVANRASLPEVVGDAGLLIDPDRAESIADALRQILMDSALASALRERGLQQARRFQWSKTARQTLSLYHRALDRS
jgi:glycosyltransferase involved in cell wall biosynthesis